MVCQLSCRQKSKFGLFSTSFTARFVDVVFSRHVCVWHERIRKTPGFTDSGNHSFQRKNNRGNWASLCLQIPQRLWHRGQCVNSKIISLLSPAYGGWQTQISCCHSSAFEQQAFLFPLKQSTLLIQGGETTKKPHPISAVQYQLPPKTFLSSVISPVLKSAGVGLSSPCGMCLSSPSQGGLGAGYPAGWLERGARDGPWLSLPFSIL